MKTRTLLSGLTLVLLPGAALATRFGDECAQSCQAKAAVAGTCGESAPAAAALPAAFGWAPATGERGMLGVYLADTDGPAVVEGLVDGGPAAQAGLQAGDRIVALDGQPVTTWQQLSESIGGRGPGERVTITLERDGWKKDLEIVLATAPEPPADAAPESVDASALPSTGFFHESVEGEGVDLEQVEGSDAYDFVIAQGVDGSGQWQGHRIEIGDGEALVVGSDGETIKTIDLSQLGEGAHEIEIEGGKAKVNIKAIVGGEVVELEEVDLDMAELHESLGKLHGLKLDTGVMKALEKCCENCGAACCQAQAGATPHVFHITGDGQIKMGGQMKMGAGGFGVVAPRAMGGVGGEGVRVFRAEATPSESSDASRELRTRVLDGRRPADQATPSEPMRIRRVAPEGAAGSDSDLDALRSELEVLREELKQLRQSLRRIQANHGQ